MDSEQQHDSAVLEAWRKLPPIGATTFDRMRDAARAEASRIESAQMVRLMAGEQRTPWPCQMKKRDDFVGIARLLDIITTNPVIMEQLKRGAPKPKAAAGEANS